MICCRVAVQLTCQCAAKLLIYQGPHAPCLGAVLPRGGESRPGRGGGEGANSGGDLVRVPSWAYIFWEILEKGGIHAALQQS